MNLEDDDPQMQNEDPWSDDSLPEPSRKPTTREKFSVLLPALIAFAGIVVMLIVFLILAISRS